MSQEVTVSQMKEMAKLYAQRLHSTSGPGSIDLNKENLIIRIDKSAIDKSIKLGGFDGFLGVLGLDNTDSANPSQTIMLVPCDSKNRPIKTNGVMLGEERHQPWPPKLKDVIYPNGGTTVDILKGINKAFDSNGIKD